MAALKAMNTRKPDDRPHSYVYVQNNCLGAIAVPILHLHLLLPFSSFWSSRGAKALRHTLTGSHRNNVKFMVYCFQLDIAFGHMWWKALGGWAQMKPQTNCFHSNWTTNGRRRADTTLSISSLLLSLSHRFSLQGDNRREPGAHIPPHQFMFTSRASTSKYIIMVEHFERESFHCLDWTNGQHFVAFQMAIVKIIFAVLTFVCLRSML